MTVTQGSTGATFTFQNPDVATNTQQAGSFRIVFPSAFENLNPGTITLSSGDPSKWTASASNGTLDLFANSAGNRLGIDQTVSVNVAFDATELGTFGPSDFDVTGDQQAGGVPAGGGNTFVLVNTSPTITVNCAAGQPCEVSAPGASGSDSGTAACPPAGCGQAGIVTISFVGNTEVCAGEDCSLWDADTTTGTANQDFFYLIIDTGGAKNPKIFAQAFDSDGSKIGGDPNVVRARNCRPPVRNFGCVDTDHPDYSKKSGIYPIRFPTTDPRGGYR